MKEILARFSFAERRKRKFKKRANRAVVVLTSLPFVEKIILFGSVASGKPTPQSDIDLCIVLNGEGLSWSERWLQVVHALTEAGFEKGNVPGAIDPIMLAPDDFKAPEKSRVCSFIDERRVQNILAGITLFDRSTQKSAE